MSLFKLCKSLFGTSDLYQLLSIDRSSKDSEIKKAYYKLSLEVHPDRVAEKEKEISTQKFQVLGKVYSILSDQEKRNIYDETGEIDEENLVSENKDWNQYWRLLFKKISIDDIKDFEVNYKESDEEIKDLKQAYLDGDGDMDYILSNVLCATIDDEERFEKIILAWIAKKEVKKLPKFNEQTKKQKDSRKRKAAKEAVEAEALKKDLGMDDTEDSLKQLILQRGQQREAMMDSLFDSLAAKYEADSKAKKTKTKKK